MTRFALTIEFDGTNFCGLQRQIFDPSIQQTIEETLHKITGEDVCFFAAGRTDSGVHARAMVAHIDVEKAFTPFRLSEAINAVVRPHPIAIIDCKIVPDDWHARFSCIGRAYEYRIMNRRAPLTLEKSKAWHIPTRLDIQAMREGAQYLIGKHDFTTFRSAHCQSKSPLKSLDRLDVRREGDYVIIEAAARSFLHHQVRSMVGCLSLVGLGKWRPEQMNEVLAAKDRTQLGLNAPPDGLYFMKAVYPEESSGE